MATGFDYDNLGRLTEVVPAGDASIVATRTHAVGLQGETLLLERKFNGGTVLSAEKVVMDGFGRNVLEQAQFPEGWASTRYEYGGNGLLSKISTPFWDAGNGSGAGHWTEFLDYDPLGRPLLTRSPDGSETELSVDREHVFTTTTQVASSLDGSQSSATKKIYRDSQGRVIQVEEPSDAGAMVATTYDYDAGGRLKRVHTPYLDDGQV